MRPLFAFCLAACSGSIPGAIDGPIGPVVADAAAAGDADSAAWPVDECAAMRAGWIFCDGFESGATAPFWDGSDTKPVAIADPGPFALAGNHVVALRVPLGRGGAGIWKKLAAHDRLYARWYLEWEPGHDLSAPHHGPGGLGADAADYTGRSGIRPSGDDYFDASFEAATASPHVLYSYTYYRGMYMDCADPNGSCWGDWFPCYAGANYCTRPEYLPTVPQAGIETGRWYCLEQLIDAGTPIADGTGADGVLDFWLDGVEIGPWTDLWWRTTASLQVNFLWIYLFNHDDTHTLPGLLVDNVVVSTERVGCRAGP